MLYALIRFQNFLHGLRDERGATAVEYGLIVVLIAAIIVGTVAAVGKDVLGGFDKVDKAMP